MGEIKEGQIMSICVTEEVIRKVELIIGEDIDLEDAIELAELMNGSDEFRDYEPGYDLLQSLIGDDDSIFDTHGYEVLDFEIKDAE